jgi:hypothetical protein|tara:strand:+ start:2400 stop:3056 length:657 start_codon:yes stop_codon:yes gene_type:complete
MKAKNKTLMSEASARKGQTFALGFTGTGNNKAKSCEGSDYIKSVPSHQQSYGLYLKRATMGIAAGGGGVGPQASGGLASRVVGKSFVDKTFERGKQQRTLTYKRPQSGVQFVASNYINNKKSKALRCEYSTLNKEGVHVCKTGNGTSGGMIGESQKKSWETNKSCIDLHGKKTIVTQDLGYLSASQHINKKISLRSGSSLTSKFESDVMNSSPSGSCQ